MMVHEFETNFGSAVTCVVQSPVVDVVAFGLLDGRIVIQNVRVDKTLLTFTQEGQVTCITFRTGLLGALMTNQ
jgi:U3 small nucleolar RNA-associated protein 21